MENKFNVKKYSLCIYTNADFEYMLGVFDEDTGEIIAEYYEGEAIQLLLDNLVSQK